MRIWHMNTCLMKILEAEITRTNCRSFVVPCGFSCVDITLIAYNVDTAFSFMRVGVFTLLLKIKKCKEEYLVWAEQYREFVKRNYRGKNRGGLKGSGAWLVYLQFIFYNGGAWASSRASQLIHRVPLPATCHQHKYQATLPAKAY